MANDAVLYTRMEVRLADAEKKLKRFEGTVDKNMSNVERSSRRAARTMETSFSSSAAKIASVFKSFGAGLLAGAAGGAVGFIAVAKDMTSNVAELGAEAEKAGLSFKAFQELKYVADQAKVPVDAITDGLKELSLRADEFAVTGKGSAAEAFQRLGLTPQEVKEKLKNPTDLLLLLIERTRLMKETAAGVRIFDELFGGTGGERMVSLINQGEAGIRAQIAAANEFGHVLSDDIIRQAQDIDREFNNIASTVGTTLKSAVVSVVSSMVDFIDGLRSVEKQRNQTLQNSINDIMAQKQAVAKSLADIDAVDNRMSDRQKNRAKGTHEIRMQQLNEQENALIKELESRPSVMTFAPQNSAAWTPPKYTPPPPTKTGSSSRDTSTAEIDRERKAVTDLLSDLQLEYDMIGKTEAQKAKMNALRQAGAAATSDEQLEIMRKVDAIYQETDAYEKVQAAAQEAQDAARDFAGTMVDGMLNGATAVETLGNALKSLASRLLDSGLNQLFSGGGLGSLFGGGGGKFPSAPGGLFADGGYTGDGGKYQPAGVVHKGEYVFDQAAVKAAGGPAAMEAMRRKLKGYASGGLVGMSAPSMPSIAGMGKAARESAPVFNIAPVIDARGADVAAVARLERIVAQMNKDLPANVISTMRSAGRRGVKF